MGEAGGGEVHFLEACVQLGGTHKPEFQFGGTAEVAPGEAKADNRERDERCDEQAQPQIPPHCGLHGRGRQNDDKTVNTLLLKSGLVFRLAHPKRTAKGRAAITVAPMTTAARRLVGATVRVGRRR